MPLPQDQLKKPASSGPAYCGICGVPGPMCQCGQYKDRSKGAVNAGSATADQGPSIKEMSSEEGGKGLPFGKKE